MIEFSPQSYGSMLEAIRSRGFEYRGFGDVASFDSQRVKLCLLRHDVDVSMEYALEMAQLEARLGVRATYFVMLRSPMYNLFGRRSSSALREIVALGHDLGLHYDAACSQGPEHDIEEWLRFEMETLGTLAGRRVTAFSFHQPSAEIIERRVEIPGAINTYHPGQLPGFKYISDSNRVWRECDPLQLLQAGFDRIHLLFHPLWWMCEDPDVQRCWDAAIRRNFEVMQSQLLATERAYGPARELALKRT
jgi:hypothetical protein